MMIVHYIFLMPLFNPVLYVENHYFVLVSGTNDSFEAAVDDHFLADKARETVYGNIVFGIFKRNIYVRTQKRGSGSGGINNRIHLGMDRPAHLVFCTVRNFQLVPQAAVSFKTIFGFAGCTDVACGDNLVVFDDNRSAPVSKTS